MKNGKIGVGIIGVQPDRSWAAIAYIPTIRERVLNTEDAKEGIRSFVERRAAVFQGR